MVCFKNNFGVSNFQISLSVIVSKQKLGTINTVYSKAMQIPGKMLQKL